jgi:ActR/RegA family two-component response regulator
MSIASNGFAEVGDRMALICDDGSFAEGIQSTLSELGFKCHSAETLDRSIEQMKHTAYDVIAVSEDLAGSTLRSNPLIRYIASLPMDQRRKSYVFLIGESLRTLDAMQAYSQSVHLVVNPNDMPNLRAILKKGLSEFERFYKTYREVLAETGELA